MKLVIYIAGPFRAASAACVAQNIENASKVGEMVIRAGHYPLVPHLLGSNSKWDMSDELILAWTQALMLRCNAMIVLPRPYTSAGTMAEITLAKNRDLPTAFMQSLNDENVNRSCIELVRALESARALYRTPLLRLDKIMDMIDPNIDCGDNSCLFKAKSGGMRTNGGCRCPEGLSRANLGLRALAQLVKEVRILLER